MEKDHEIEIDEVIEETAEFGEGGRRGFRGRRGGPHVFAMKFARGGRGKGCCIGGPMEVFIDKHGHERGRIPLHHVSQKVIDDELHVAVVMPGMDKASFKIRAKSDTIALDAKDDEKYRQVLGEREISLSIHLNERIDPDTISAKYADGILLFTAKVEPAKEVSVD